MLADFSSRSPNKEESMILSKSKFKQNSKYFLWIFIGSRRRSFSHGITCNFFILYHGFIVYLLTLDFPQFTWNHGITLRFCILYHGFVHSPKIIKLFLKKIKENSRIYVTIKYIWCRMVTTQCWKPFFISHPILMGFLKLPYEKCNKRSSNRFIKSLSHKLLFIANIFFSSWTKFLSFACLLLFRKEMFNKIFVCLSWITWRNHGYTVF